MIFPPKSLFALILSLSFSFLAHAEIKTEVVEYKQGSTPLEGYLAYDSNLKGKRPAILIVHEWNGLGDYVKGRAKQLAEKGYVAFAADIYGKGVRPKTPKESGAEASKYKNDRKLMRERAQAGLDYVKKLSFVDPDKIIAMGYCFGGTVALEMGRAGMPLAGITSFHGGLGTPNPADAKNIKGKVLVLQGGIDPSTKDEVPAFLKEMNDAGVDYQMITYGNTVHAFTNPEVGNDPKKGVAYNASSDKRSFQAFMDFLHEVAPL